MFRKNYFASLLAIALFLTGTIAIFAQTAPISGRVELKKADGTTAPVAGAMVEVFRTDIKAKFPSAKTDKKGNFNFAGLPIGSMLTLSISAQGVKSDFLANVKAGSENLVITLNEGDGKRLAEDEVRKALADTSTAAAAPVGGKPAELTAEQKKQQAEYDKQVADVTSKNKKIEQSTTIIKTSLEEGSKAFEAKNFDLAIAKFDEGYNADPDFAGTAPVLLNNKSSVLINRATINYNLGVKNPDAAAKKAAMDSVKADYANAVTASDKAIKLLTGATAPDATVQKNYDANKFQALANRKEAYRLMTKTGADRTKGKETLTAFSEYIALETDAKKKSDAQLALAEALQDSQEFDLAIVEFEKVLVQTPDNIEALAGAGFSLVNVGYINSDKSKFQQGANYLQKFSDLAPDSHKYKTDAKGLIETLKKEQSVAPQKIAKPAARKKS
ncbi:MAG: carboxypeptidase regulatory-like domain-containing protein [Acidobacteria bacterium]|jgi:tetratricopeptide (TPR) repeat protein|nr:carboxypeptidase regulatory-like domain-containing protein [Acidobacteriota bacterium]